MLIFLFVFYLFFSIFALCSIHSFNSLPFLFFLDFLSQILFYIFYLYSFLISVCFIPVAFFLLFSNTGFCFSVSRIFSIVILPQFVFLVIFFRCFITRPLLCFQDLFALPSFCLHITDGRVTASYTLNLVFCVIFFFAPYCFI